MGTYLVSRLFLLEPILRPAAAGGGSLCVRLLTLPKVIIWYLRLLFLPFNLHMERRVALASSLFEPQVYLPLIVLVLIGILVLWMYKRSRLAFFSLAWFFLTLLPVSNVFPLNAMMAEHWLYLPSLGFFLFVSLGIARALETEKKKLIVTLIVLILTFYSFLTVRRNRDWRDGLTLYQNTLKYSPGSGRVHNNLGNIYLRKGDYDRALQEYKSAVELKPDLAEGYFNLGEVYSRRKEYDRAVEQYKTAIELNPDLIGAYYGLGIAYRGKGELDKAIKEWEKTLEIMQDRRGIRLDKSERERIIEILKGNEKH